MIRLFIISMFVHLCSFNYTNAQTIDTTEIQYFKILNNEANAGVFIGCGVFDEGYLGIGSSAKSTGEVYLSLKKYSFTGELLADLELDNENTGYGQVNYGRCLAQVNETEWVLAYRGIATDGNSDIRVIKFNLGGDVLWKTDFGREYSDKARTVIITKDGNVVIVGESFISNTQNVKKAFFVQLNNEGEILTEYLDETDILSNSSNYTKVIEVNEKLYVSGRKEFAGEAYAFVDIFNEEGEFVEEVVFWEYKGCSCTLISIPNKPDEMYFTSCNTEDGFYIRGVVDKDFSFVWQKSENYDDALRPPPINHIVLEDERYISIDEYYEFHPQYGYLTQLQLFGLDPEGNLEFVTKIPTDLGKEVYARDLRKTPDGGYLIAAYEHFPSPQRGWLIKTDSLGNCCQLPNCDSIGYVIDTVFTSNFDITTAQSGVKIFPNPIQKNGLVNVVLNDSYDAIESSQIFSIDGKQLFFSANDNTNQVPTNNLVSGIYMLKIRTRKGVTYTRRLVVK